MAITLMAEEIGYLEQLARDWRPRHQLSKGAPAVSCCRNPRVHQVEDLLFD